MNSGTGRETAKIYPFPTGGRAGVGQRTTTQTDERAAVRAPVTVAGGAWYHDAAIQDADRSRKP
jgi:hypothetical protein